MWLEVFGVGGGVTSFFRGLHGLIIFDVEYIRSSPNTMFIGMLSMFLGPHRLLETEPGRGHQAVQRSLQNPRRHS